MITRFCVGLFVLGLCFSSGVPAIGTSTSTYDLNVAESVDTPTRTISIDGENHEVSAIAKATPGETLSVSVSAPRESKYRVTLYDSDRRATAQRPATGDANVQFDLTNYDPGSYMLFLYKNGDYKDAYPVVIQGYDMTTTFPSQVSVTSELNITVTAEKTTDVENPAEVRVILASGDQSIQATATSQGSQQYRATISLTDVEPGQARIYAVVQGSKDAFKDGRKELLGISDESTVTISQPTTQTTTKTTGKSEPPTTSQTQSVTPTTSTTTATQSTTLSSSNSSTTKAISQRTTTSITTESQPPSTGSSPVSTTVTESTIDSSVITPEESATASEPSNQNIPGFRPIGTLFALSCFLVLLRQR